MHADSEPRFPRPLSGERVDPLPSGLAPARQAIDGRHVRLEPMDPAVHADDLYEASHASEEGRAIWGRREAFARRDDGYAVRLSAPGAVRSNDRTLSIAP